MLDPASSEFMAHPASRSLIVSKNPGNELQKKSQKQEAEAADKKPRHPSPPVAFGHKRKEERDKPHE